MLTARGQRFLDDARELLATAARMQESWRADAVRTAHIFELDTSRAVVDTFVRAHPDVEVLEHAMDSITQLDALFQNRLDVAIIRVTSRMLIEQATGWRHQLLRLEPLVLVGRASDERKTTASLHERPLEVFGDPPESGTYNAHGVYLNALERELGVSMRWIGTPGAFSHCLEHVSRATSDARFLEFNSYARRHQERRLPVYQPEEAQPYYPWSLAWRDEDPTPATAHMVRDAQALSAQNGWLEATPLSTAPPWLPADDPGAAEALEVLDTGRVRARRGGAAQG